MSDSGNDVWLDALAGIFSEQETVLKAQGQEAFLDKVFDDAPMVGSLWVDLNNSGMTDAEIQAEVHMRQYTGQGFTHITFADGTIDTE